MKNQAEIFNQVSKTLIELFEIEPEDISLQAHLYHDLDIDSIDAVDLIVKLKELTGKKINPEDFKKVRTVEDIVNAVDKVINEG